MNLIQRDREGFYSNYPDTEIFCTKDSENFIGTIMENKGSQRVNSWSDLASRMKSPPS